MAFHGCAAAPPVISSRCGDPPIGARLALTPLSGEHAMSSLPSVTSSPCVAGSSSPSHFYPLTLSFSDAPVRTSPPTMQMPCCCCCFSSGVSFTSFSASATAASTFLPWLSSPEIPTVVLSLPSCSSMPPIEDPVSGLVAEPIPAASSWPPSSPLTPDQPLLPAVPRLPRARAYAGVSRQAKASAGAQLRIMPQRVLSSIAWLAQKPSPQHRSDDPGYLTQAALGDGQNDQGQRPATGSPISRLPFDCLDLVLDFVRSHRTVCPVCRLWKDLAHHRRVVVDTGAGEAPGGVEVQGL
eukprot:RCo033378